jgi:hypothetical protein
MHLAAANSCSHSQDRLALARVVLVITLDAHSVAQSLGGQVAGLNRIQCPGPNHSRRDRSLTVWIEPDAPDGFRVYSHAGDDALVCKDYIRAQLGMSPWRPEVIQSPIGPPHNPGRLLPTIMASNWHGICGKFVSR